MRSSDDKGMQPIVPCAFGVGGSSDAVASDWDSERFEDAADLVAKMLASFRLGLDADDPYAYNENEKLKAGIIVGSLTAWGFIDDTKAAPNAKD